MTSHTSTSRLFIAVEPCLDVVDKLLLLQKDLDPIIASRKANVRWITPENIHLTMKFIGEVEEFLIPSIGDALSEIALKHQQFQMNTVGIGAFPKGGQPRIIYAGVNIGVKNLMVLNEDLDTRLSALGIAPEQRPFKAHLTIGRIKTRKPTIDLTDVLKALENIVFGHTRISELVLFKSTLTPKGAIYRVLKRIQLTS